MKTWMILVILNKNSKNMKNKKPPQMGRFNFVNWNNVKLFDPVDEAKVNCKNTNSYSKVRLCNKSVR